MASLSNHIENKGQRTESPLDDGELEGSGDPDEDNVQDKIRIGKKWDNF